jgi:hypothetical protein
MPASPPVPPSRADRKFQADLAKEARAVLDPMVRRVLGEMGDAVWGRNGRFRRKWRLTSGSDTWAIGPSHGAEAFRVSLDLGQQMFRVDGAGDPLFTESVSEEQLRRALAVAHHRVRDQATR